MAPADHVSVIARNPKASSASLFMPRFSPAPGRTAFAEIAALFGCEPRHARLAAKPANTFQHARREKDASGRWHDPNVARIPRRDAIPEALCCFRILNELAL
jgi:hypothetical protein